METMKKNWIILHAAVAILSLFMLTSCYDKLAEAFSMKPLYLNASVEEPRAATRASTNIQGSWFDKDELIAVYISKTGDPSYRVEDGSGNVHYPAIYKTSSPNESTHMNVLTFSPQLYYPIGNGDEKPNVDIHAYYPATVTNTQTVFSVDKDQTGADGDEKYKKSDLMFAKVENQGRTSGSVNLNFNHKMVKFLFNVVPDGDVTIDDCYLRGVQTTIGFDPETGEVSTLSEGASNRKDVKLDNGGAVIIPPQTLSGEFIAVRGTAREDGQTDKIDQFAIFSLYDESSGMPTERVLESGKVYTVNLSVGYANFGNTYNIGNWNDDAGVISVATMGSSGFSIDNTSFEAGGYDYTGEELKPKPTVKYGATKVLVEGTDYDLRYFNNVHVGKATVLAIGKGAYEGYAVAGSFIINQVPSILQFTEEDGTTKKTALSVEYVRNYTINPTATTPKDIHLNITGNGTMSYAISRVNGDATTDVNKVATIDGAGVITVKGTGKVLVTATMADDKDYLESSTSFTLTITAKQYDPNNSEIKAYYINGEGQEISSPTFTYDKQEHKPAVKVVDKVGEDWVDITSSCTVTYPDGGINANDEAKVNIKLNAPYAGEIVMTYKINKATPTIRITQNGADLSPQTKELYLALPNNNTEANLSWTRVGITDFGVVKFKPKNNATNNICTVRETTAEGADTRTTAVFSAIGSSAGDITFTASVEATDNWQAANVDFTIHVVESYKEIGYTGKTYKWTCPASGTYLLEAWGAQGGNVPKSYSDASSIGGGGAYVKAKVALTKGRVLYVNCGQGGLTIDKNYSPYWPVSDGGDGVEENSTGSGSSREGTVVVKCNAWNGGGEIVWGLKHAVTTGWDYWKSTDPLCGGGGATDISLSWSGDDSNWKTLDHLLTRILVAGGGGGALYYSNENDAGNGGAGGAWEGALGGGRQDPGEGATLYRGGLSALYNISSSLWNNHSSLDSYYETAKTFTTNTAHYDGRPGRGSASCGIFGYGGYYTCVAEGGGAGGGGWYGGGSCGQQGGNGAGGGGSSYVWDEAHSSFYPTLASLTSSNYITYHYGSGTGVKTPKDLGFPYLTDATSTMGQNTASDNPETVDGCYKKSSSDGYVHITCLSTTN